MRAGPAVSAGELVRAIGEVLRVVGRSGSDLGVTLEAIAEHANRLCDAEYSYVYLAQGESLHLAASSGGSAEQWAYEREHPTALGRTTLVGRVASERAIQHIHDVRADPEYDNPVARELGGYRTLLGVPIEYEGELIGVIGLARTDVRPFEQAQVELTAGFAYQAALAIGVARLLRENRDAFEREQAIAEVLSAINSASFDLQSVLQTVIERAVMLCGADHGDIVRRDGELYREAAHHGIGSAEYLALLEEATYAPGRGTMVGRALLDRRTVHVPDVLADAEYEFSDAQRLGGFRTHLTVPLLRDDSVIGVMALWRRQVRPFSGDEVRLVETLADQAAIAIAKVQLFDTIQLQREELSHYVSAPVAALISSESGEELLSGHRREVTVVFCDLRGFTSFSETAEPEEVLDVLREYHATLGRLVEAHHATLEHFAGDGVMLFLNDPEPVPDHALQAVRLATAVRAAFLDVAAGWSRRGHELGLGIGIATGYATIGRIGYEGRYEYAAIGAVTILASRLSDQAAPAQILISRRTQAAIDGRVTVEPTGPLDLEGFSKPVDAYSVVDLAS